MLFPPQNKILIWVLILVGLFVYLPTLFNGFVWDDEELIVNNPQIRSLTNLPAFFSGSTFNSGGGGNLSGLYYRPMMLTAFTFIYSIFGLNATFFHLGQIVFHIANACLLYLILFYLFRKFAVKEDLAFFAALLFLVHPISVEAVSYSAGFQEGLFFFFGALAFLLILANNRPKKIFWATTLILLSLLSKETGAVFASIILIYLILFEKEKLKPFLFGIAASVAVYSFFRFVLAKVYFAKHGLAPISNLDLSGRLTNVPQIISTYLTNFMWPQNLAIDQQWLVSSVTLGPVIICAVTIIISAALSYLIYKYRRKVFGLWIFFLIWFLAALSFHLQIFPLDMTVSDRWFYLSLAGLSGLIFIAADLFRIKNTKIFWCLALVLILRTIVREFDWNNGLSLYGRDIKISQNAYSLENNYGVELFRAGDIATAKIHFQKSTQLLPNWWTNWNNLGAVSEREGDLENAKMYYRKAIDNGQYYLAYENYAKILYRQGKKAELKTFLKTEALKVLPNNVLLQQMLMVLENPNTP